VEEYCPMKGIVICTCHQKYLDCQSEDSEKQPLGMSMANGLYIN
jgi:hypothetical protein